MEQPLGSNGHISFDPFVTLSRYRSDIASTFRGHAAYLRAELDVRFLEVALFDADPAMHSGHRIRRAVNTNPLWYRKLYDERRVRRHLVKASLERIQDAKDLPSNGTARTGSSIYDGELRAVIFDQLTNGIEDMIHEQPHYFPPDPNVVALFAAYFR